MTEKSTISEESVSPELAAVLSAADANSAAFEAALTQRPNGTGLDYSDVVAQIAKTNLANAEQAGETTWVHLLDVAVTEVQAEAEPVELAAKLGNLLVLAETWLNSIKEAAL